MTRKERPQFYNHKGLNSANNHVTFKDDPDLMTEPADASIVGPDKIQPSNAWLSDSLECRDTNCVLFYATRFKSPC